MWQPLENLFVMVLPLGALSVAGSITSTGPIIPRADFGDGLLAHVLISLLAYTALAMAAGQSIILALQERSLRQKSSIGFVKLLPPLQTMETLLFQLLWVGLITLTLSIGSGFLFLTDMFAQSVVSHTILASASWVIFAVLLAGRYAFGWRSTLATRATLVGFTLLVFAYFGSKFVIEILLGKQLMDEPVFELSTLLMAIGILVLLSAFFSGSETAMMALNRYRLQHLVKEGDAGARKAYRLLKRPDRLLGVVLIGNILVNNLGATAAALVGFELFGDTGLAAAPFVITLVFLIFSEVAPKTVAAHSPERIAFPAAYILSPLLKLLYPFVVLVNGMSNFILRPFLRPTDLPGHDHLSMDELRTMLLEGARIPKRPQDMLLRIVDLETVSVDDIMVHRNEIVGIDIDAPMTEIIAQIASSQHTRLPVFKENINNVIGILHLRRTVRFIQQNTFTKTDLLQLTQGTVFRPSGNSAAHPAVQLSEAEAPVRAGRRRVRRHRGHRHARRHPRRNRWRIHDRFCGERAGNPSTGGRLVLHRRRRADPRREPRDRLAPADRGTQNVERPDTRTPRVHSGDEPVLSDRRLPLRDAADQGQHDHQRQGPGAGRLTRATARRATDQRSAQRRFIAEMIAVSDAVIVFADTPIP